MQKKNIDYNPSSDCSRIIILLNTLARITRFVTAQLIWAEEFARYLMIWMAFIGAALVMQEDGHYKMTAVVDALPASIRGIVRGCAVLATVAFMLILARSVECCMCGHGREVSDSENPDVDCVCIDPGRNDFRSGAGCSARVNRLVSGKDEKGRKQNDYGCIVCRFIWGNLLWHSNLFSLQCHPGPRSVFLSRTPAIW